MKILCSGHLVRYPLGGHSWHQLHYLIGFDRLGHDVIFFETHGWPYSCYDPSINDMTDDPSFGLAYMQRVFDRYGLGNKWCYVREDGTTYGLSREELTGACRDCDVFFNLSNVNWIPDLELSRRRVLVDTDPVFTQIGKFGIGGPFEQYHALFTYGENVHKPHCSMPTGGVHWRTTRQPVVLDLWPVEPGDRSAPFTSVMNWSNFGAREFEGRVYGQKDREFTPFFDLPHETNQSMELAINAPDDIKRRLIDGGWRLRETLEVTPDPWVYQQYLRSSRAEFCVAKHAYVSTWCGWFSDRSASYLASARPVVIQDTGFSEFLDCGEGLLAYRTHDEAVENVARVAGDYDRHSRAARRVAEEFFDSRRVLPRLLEDSFK